MISLLIILFPWLSWLKLLPLMFLQKCFNYRNVALLTLSDLGPLVTFTTTPMSMATINVSKKLFIYTAMVSFIPSKVSLAASSTYNVIYHFQYLPHELLIRMNPSLVSSYEAIKESLIPLLWAIHKIYFLKLRLTSQSWNLENNMNLKLVRHQQ